jgi:hypothetical protein
MFDVLSSQGILNNGIFDLAIPFHDKELAIVLLY